MMFCRHALTVSALLFSAGFIASSCYAAPTESELRRRCDSNQDNKIDQSEAEGLAQLRASSDLAAHDFDCNGSISALELPNIDAAVASDLATDGGYIYGDLLSQIELGGPLPVEVVGSQGDPPERPPGRIQRVFVGRNLIDTRISIINAESSRKNLFSAGVGASVSAFSDQIDDVDSLAIDAVVTFLLFDPRWRDTTQGARAVSGLSFAPYLDVEGTISSADETERSRVSLGLESQLEIGGGVFDISYIGFSPFYQTDFEGEARIFGLSASWTPVREAWRLGGGRIQTGRFIDRFVWDAEANVDLQLVDRPGQTGLNEDQYAWFGAEANARFVPFGDIATQRLYFEFGGSSHWNAYNGQSAELFTAAIGSNITDDGRVSTSIRYESGRRHLTLEEVDSVTWGFEFKF